MTRNVRKIRSKTGSYTSIIEVMVPVRFFWAKEGFDGIEIGPLREPTPYEMQLIYHVLDTIGEVKFAEVPEAFLEAFHAGPEING